MNVAVPSAIDLREPQASVGVVTATKTLTAFDSLGSSLNEPGK